MVRSCEEVRRFAAVIGQLGQWARLVRGCLDWIYPADLPDLDDAHTQAHLVLAMNSLTSQIIQIATTEIHDSRDSTDQNVRRLRREAGRHRPENHSYHENHLIYSLLQSNRHAPRLSTIGARLWTHRRRRLQERTSGRIRWAPLHLSPRSHSTTHVPYATYLNRIGRSTAAIRQPQAASTPSGAAPLSESPKSWNVEEGMADVCALNQELSRSIPVDGLKVPTMTPITPNTQENRLGLGISNSTEANALTSERSPRLVTLRTQ